MVLPIQEISFKDRGQVEFSVAKNKLWADTLVIG